MTLPAPPDPAPSHPASPAHGIGSRVDRGTRGSTGNRAGTPWLPDGAPSSRVLVAAGVVGVVVAMTLTGSYSGVGWTLAAVAVAVAMPVVGWRPQRAVGAVLPPWVAWAESGWIPLAVALAVVPAVLDAEWLSGLCLLAALGAGSLGVVGRRDRPVLRGMLAVPAATVRGIAWAARAVTGRAAGPSQHGPSQHGPVAGCATPARFALSLLAGVGLLAVFAPLMAGADPAFATVLDGLVPRVDAAGTVWWAVRFALGAAVVLAAAVLLAARTGPQLGPAQPSPLRSVEWTVPIGLLVGLFALFVATTLTTLFGSDEHVRATTGLTYAEYARGGFWQLLAVSGLTMVVVVTGLRWTPLRSPGDRLRVRLLLGSLVVLTLVVVASALYRMWLYQEAYGLTVLRLMVAATEVWLAIGFVIMLVSVVRLRPDRPTRGVVAAGMLTLLVLAAMNPERIVAEQNVARWADSGRIDIGYLGGLSADAAPVLATLPEPVRSCALAGLPSALDGAATEGWAGANVSRSRASTLLAGTRPTCPGAS